MPDDYISLKNIRLRWTLAGSSEIIVAEALEIQVPLTMEFFDRTPGGSWFGREVPGEMKCVMKINGWNNPTTINTSNLYPGLRLSTFSLLTVAGATSVLPPNFFTWFPIALMMFGNTETGFTKDPSKWQTELRTNVSGDWNPA